jgi:acetyltransferase
MEESNKKESNLGKLFFPKDIAFIGASESSRLGSMLYLPSFKSSMWKNSFYPVNPNHEQILGWKCYKSILDIPNKIDLAFISVKAPIIPTVLKECVQKDVLWVIIFSSGFSETRNKNGKKLEEILLRIIEGSNTRIIGPNCLGPFNSLTGMAFTYASSLNKPGTVSFMSQSGGHLSQLIDIGVKRDIRFRFGISFGNQIDLNCVDFLKFFRNDRKTEIICAYLESFGSGSGKAFFLELKKTTILKPVIIWKGGYTMEGNRAAFSHTGAISSELRLWKSMAKQTGAILVKDNEEWWNSMKTFELLYPKLLPKGNKVIIITPGGGASVNFTDMFSSKGLHLPELSNKTQVKIRRILPEVNVIIENPIDLGASGFIINIYLKCVELVIEDPNIDIIIMPLWPDHIYRYVIKRIIKIQKSTNKPIIIILPNLADDIKLATKFERIKKILHNERMLYFLSPIYAAKSIANLYYYVKYLRNRNISNF